MSKSKYDLGGGYSYRHFIWAPDRKLNPQYAGMPDINPAGIIIEYQGEPIAAPWFDSPEARAANVDQAAMWDLLSLHPLTIHPSVQAYGRDRKPSHHGWIRDGRWVPA